MRPVWRSAFRWQRIASTEIYETVMQVAGSDVMKEKAMEMKQAIDCQMTWESIIKRIEDLV